MDLLEKAQLELEHDREAAKASLVAASSILRSEIERSSGGGQAATGQLASALGVSPGTVTSMLKTLSESNLVTYTPYEGVRLTEAECVRLPIPADAEIVIEGTLRQGDVLPEGPRVLAIDRDGVELSYRGTEFMLRPQ